MVNVTRLSIKGFKSFGKFTPIDFPKGFTAIVGPNGSGKSNIIDSLCFVLGRRSVKSLRADRLAQLVFNGAKTGKAASRAAVAIKFDNSGHELPVESKEVEIERDIGRDGKSTFRINGVRSTRAQIADVLSKARIHPDGHNIILQGDVARIIEMNALERREIIDEISGISEYEEKKNRAVRELEKVDGKIGEAKAVFREREKYLKNAEAERNQALRYQDINKRLAQYRGELFAIKIKKANKELEIIAKDYKKIDSKETELKEKHKGKDQEIEQAQKRINEIDEVLLKTKSIAEGNELDEKRDEISEIEKSIERLNESIRLKEEELTSITSDDAQKEIKQLKTEQVAMREELKETKSKLEKQDDFVSKLQKEKIDLMKRVQELDQEFGTKNREYTRIASEYETQQSGAGYPRAIQEVLGLRGEMKGIHGPVSELADVPDKYQLAISVAAGRRIHSVVVDDDTVAEKCIDHLKSRKAGRVTFFPLNKIKGHKVENVSGTKNAIDLVSFKPEYRKIFEHVFQSTLVVDSVDKARKLGIGKYRMVTLEGELFERSGAITGGTVKKVQSFSKDLEKDVDKLSAELKAIEELRNSSQYELQQKTDEFEKENNILCSLEREKERLVGTLDGILSKVRAISEGGGRQSKIQEELEAQRKEFEEVSDKLKSAQESFDKLKNTMVKAEGKQSEERSTLLEKIEKVRDENKKVYLQLSDLNRERNELEVEKAKIDQRLVDVREAYKEYEGKELEIKHGERELENMISKNEKDLAELGSVNMLAIEAYDTIKKDYEDLVSKMEKLEEEKQAVMDFMDEIETKKQEIFMETFLEISSKFEDTFKKLSPGGEAHLILQSPDTPFEGGMLIQARPKGKELINIEALSGGEKTMTALAFIFAIQLYRPAPFYILDEVDAALDKVNSDMLGNMIAESAKAGTAQFIIITHNDSVLEQADRLYGVTMTDSGSQIVGVEMD